MGTRAAIGRNLDEPGHWEAVYTHWDGYPDHHVPALFRLVAEANGGDVDGALRYLLEENPRGFSIFNGAGVASHAWRTDGLSAAESEDLDHVYAPDESGGLLQSHNGDGEGPDDAGQEWLYLLDHECIRVFKWGGVGMFGQSAGAEIRPLAFYRWADGCPDEAELARVTEQGYARARDEGTDEGTGASEPAAIASQAS